MDDPAQFLLAAIIAFGALGAALLVGLSLYWIARRALRRHRRYRRHHHRHAKI
jgi:hypothetical protein